MRYTTICCIGVLCDLSLSQLSPAPFNVALPNSIRFRSTQLGLACSDQRASQPRSQAASQLQPGSQPAKQPASQLASQQPHSQPAQPATQLASRPFTQPACQPASHLASHMLVKQENEFVFVVGERCNRIGSSSVQSSSCLH